MATETEGASAPIARPPRVDPLEKYKDTLDPLRQQYDGRIAPFVLGKHGLFVFRYATGSELRLHSKKIREASKQVEAEARNELVEFETVEFTKRMLVHPAEKAAFAVALEDYWQTGPTILLAINRISGASVEELGKD